MNIMILFLFSGFLLMFLSGFLSQIIFEKLVDTHPNRGKFKLTYCFPDMFKILLIRFKIKFFRNIISKYKIYYEETKKKHWNDIGDKFLSTVIEKEKSSRSGLIIQAVLHEQEKNRRKSETSEEKKDRKRFFYAREVIFSKEKVNGLNHMQIPYSIYLDYFVQYNMFLKGKKVSRFSLSQAVLYFGNEKEKEIMLNSNENNLDFEKMYFKSMLAKRKKEKRSVTT